MSSRKYVHVLTHFSKSPLNCDQKFSQANVLDGKETTAGAPTLNPFICIAKNEAMKNMETWGLMYAVDLVKPRVLYMAVDNVTLQNVPGNQTATI